MARVCFKCVLPIICMTVHFYSLDLIDNPSRLKNSKEESEAGSILGWRENRKKDDLLIKSC